MKVEGLTKYLFNIFFLFFFSLLSSLIAFKLVSSKSVEITKKPIKKVVKKKRFIKKKDFDYFLDWNPETIESIDVKAISFVAIEELFNTSKILVNLLYLKKIKILLKEKIDKKSKAVDKIESLLNNIKTDSPFIRNKRDYILLKFLFKQEKYDTFIVDYEKTNDEQLKESLMSEYLASLLNVKENQKAIDTFKGWYLLPKMKISKLETVLRKKKLKILFNSFDTEDWIKSFVFFVNENKQGTIKKLSNYINSNQISALFNAEYNYSKKRYSNTVNILKKVKDERLLGFKKRILFKIRIRREKYDLILSQAEELSAYSDAYKGFLLNAAKLLVKDRPDLSELMFEKYIIACKKAPVNIKKSNTEISEYWSAMWRLAWLYYRNGKIEKVKKILKEGLKSEFLSYKLASEYWLSKFEGRYSKFIEKHPFSYYYVLYNWRKGRKKITRNLDNFNVLFPVKKTKHLKETVENIKVLLRYGLVREITNYIDSEIKSDYLNKTDRNYLKFISLILAVKEEKYGKSIWRYGKIFENYKKIQLPPYLINILLPLKYENIIKKHCDSKQIDPYLIMALIKQESTFKAVVVSPSRAYGLMQLLLRTANRMARKYKRNVYKTNLFNPDTNIKYGVDYFKMLLNKYNNNIYYSLAAYNAGEHRVDAWLEQTGNVTNEEFVEMIPFTETRNYVKLIIRNYYYYKFYYD